MGLFKKLKGAAVTQLKKAVADPANRAAIMGQAQKFADRGVSALQSKVAQMRRGGKVKKYGKCRTSHGRRRGSRGRFV